MDRRVAVSLVAVLTATAVLVAVAADYEAWRLAEMDRNPFITAPPFGGTFRGGLMTVATAAVWGVASLAWVSGQRRKST
jgi:hypothetical protein